VSASALRSGLLSLVCAVAVVSAQPAPATRVLFIGNSLTYSNDLPAMVCALARAAGRHAVCESVAKPDYSLEDHWNERDARRAIARGWDVVVLQQGPSALDSSRVLLVEYATRFDREIRQAGARTALYMVWPSRARRGDFDGVSRSYTAAARAVGGQLLPVGDAWRQAWAIDASLAFYSSDGLHPSPLGTALASIVIFQQLFSQPVPAIAFPGVTPPRKAILLRASENALARVSP
jgi:hypothetical protein